MKVGCAVVSDDFSETMRIPDGSSIFTAEAKAIYWFSIRSYCWLWNFLQIRYIFRLPFSFKIFRSHVFKNPQIQKLLEKHHDSAECNEIIYCWIPSHIGITGNENVDQKAKDSLNLHPTNFLLPYLNLYPFINRYIVNKWQLLWNNSLGNKLFAIKNSKWVWSGNTTITNRRQPMAPRRRAAQPSRDTRKTN